LLHISTEEVFRFLASSSTHPKDSNGGKVDGVFTADQQKTKMRIYRKITSKTGKKQKNSCRSDGTDVLVEYT